MKKKETLGEILIQKNMVSARKINQALQIQAGGNKRLGQILIHMRAITEEQLFDALSDQYGIPIAVLNRKLRIPKEVKTILPRYLCKKYCVFPFEKANDHVLKIAMVNPLDQAARTDIEAFTGMLVRPYLTREKEILKMIDHFLGHSMRDYFYPFFYNRILRRAGITILVLSALVLFFIHREIQLEKYGTISESGNLKVFSNHEMLIGVEGEGAISLIGHGPYAKGFYSVVFETPEALLQFVEKNKNVLTQQQLEWIDWVISKKLPAMKK